MKFLIIFTTLAVAAMAMPLDEQVVSVTQDTLGRYKLAVKTLDSSRTEERDANGHVNGGYSFIDANGVLQTIQYNSGVNGFQVSGSNLPVAPIDYNLPVQDTPEVAYAKAVHLAKLAEFRN